MRSSVGRRVVSMGHDVSATAGEPKMVKEVSTMVRAAWWDENIVAAASRQVWTTHQVRSLLQELVDVPGTRGVPAVELHDEIGSSLVLAFDTQRASLTWSDATGRSSTSVGELVSEDVGLTYDFMGSWSEAPSSSIVLLSSVWAVVQAFVEHGSPVGAGVSFTPD